MFQPTVTLQTPPGKGGIAVLSLAGDGGESIVAKVFRPLRTHAVGGSGVLQLGHLVDGDNIIDETILCRCGGNFEINIHGGPAVARAAMELLVRCGAKAVPATPSAPDSFPLSHPKWQNPAIGRELLEALPQAHSLLAVTALSRQWSAGLSELAAEILAKLRQNDFHSAKDELGEYADLLRRAADGLSVMQRLLQPAEVVLAGPPNAGKSTLANALVGRRVSIVHPAAGTTRDWVRELAIINGVPIFLTDTAGLWPQADGVDAEAVNRARRRTLMADLVLLLSACDDGGAAADESWLEGKKILRVVTKCDIRPSTCSGRPEPVEGRLPMSACDVVVSAVSGQNMDQLQSAIVAAIGLAGVDFSAPLAFTDRQAILLHAAADALGNQDCLSGKTSLATLLQG